MKTTSLVSLVSVLCSSIAFAAETDSTARQLQVFPKNLARQHVGSNLFVFNPTNQTFGATEASAAWLDDDVATGWPVMAGKQHYLLVLSEPELLTNFSVSTRPAAGTISLFAGDEPAAPGAKSWTLVAKDVAVDSINNKKLAKSFSRFAKYLLIETNIAEPGPLFGLQVYGEKSSISYSLRKRSETIDARAIFGQYVNDQTNFNTSGLYANSRVTYANSPDGFISWQKAIDDNPETGISISGSAQSSAVIGFSETRRTSRISLLTDAGAKGKLDVFAVKATSAADAVTPVSNTSSKRTAQAARSEVSIEGLTPTVSIVLDGANTRSSLDFPAVEADQLVVRWSPVAASENLTIREINTFNGLTLNDYEVSLSPEAVAEFSGDASDASKDGKDMIDPKKNPLDPVAIGPNGSPIPT
jgi:hypothetical protein